MELLLEEFIFVEICKISRNISQGKVHKQQLKNDFFFFLEYNNNNITIMAECFDEFDAPSPMPKRYCSRISIEEYESIGNTSTELSLQQLLQYLDHNPTAFFDILTKKKEEEKDSSGFFALLKSKLTSWYLGASAGNGGDLDIKEAKMKLKELKENLVKSYNYAQGKVCIVKQKVSFKGRFSEPLTKTLDRDFQKKFYI